jgi:hypothetical protein
LLNIGHKEKTLEVSLKDLLSSLKEQLMFFEQKIDVEPFSESGCV